MLTYKQLKTKLSEATKVIKTIKVGKKSTAEIQQNGSKFSVVIDGEVLDDKYKSAKDAETAAKEFADLMGT
jgi:uncharacterized protein YacL (UPF0231 family)